MSDAENPDAPPLVESAESINRARRRLLGMAKYVPPAIVGIIVLQQAGCQPLPSCGPGTNPCGPNGNPCGPDTCPPNICMPNGGCNPNPVAPDPTGTQGGPLSDPTNSK